MDRFSESNQFEGPTEGNQEDEGLAAPHGLSSQAQGLAAIDNLWKARLEAEADANFHIGHTLNDLLGSPNKTPDRKGQEILKFIVEKIGIPRKTLNKYRRTAWAFPMPEDDWG